MGSEYLIGQGPDPKSLVQIDLLPPFSGLLGDGDNDAGTIRFQVYYDFPGHKLFSPWTRTYTADELPAKLKWADMWPKGDPTHN